jgi:hypothetical protein
MPECLLQKIILWLKGTLKKPNLHTHFKFYIHMFQNAFSNAFFHKTFLNCRELPNDFGWSALCKLTRSLFKELLYFPISSKRSSCMLFVPNPFSTPLVPPPQMSLDTP